jgi:hypothetical protein
MLESLDHVDLPARAVPLEHRRVQVGDQPVELLVRSRRRQREVHHVMAHVDGIDLLPLRHTDLREDRYAVEGLDRPGPEIGIDDLLHDLPAT